THPAWSPSLRNAEPKDLSPGSPVVHPTFGPGIVEFIESAEAGPAKMKVGVRFQDTSETKKLVFKFAKLAAAPS
ncbi:MAG: hypothetical protein K1X79_00490, partial [Oligoflexia bacterium]|nr:hypothetical protein [Oligoflexia bacterium]